MHVDEHAEDSYIPDFNISKTDICSLWASQRSFLLAGGVFYKHNPNTSR